MKAKTLLILSFMLLMSLSAFLMPRYAEGTIAQSSSLTFNANEDDTRDLVIYGSYMYAAVTGLNPARVVKIDLSTFTRVDAVTLASGRNNPNAIVTDGTYLYVLTGSVPTSSTNRMKVTRISIGSFTVTDSLDLGANYISPDSAVIVGDYLYISGAYDLDGIAGGASEAVIAKVQLSTFTLVDYLTLSETDINQMTGLAYYDTYLYGIYLNFTSVTGYVVKVDEIFFGVQSSLNLGIWGTEELDIVGDNLYAASNNGTGIYLSKVDLNTFTLGSPDLLLSSTLYYAYGHLNHYGSNQLFIAFNEAPAKIVEVNLGSWAVTQTLELGSGDDDAEPLLVQGSILYAGLRCGYTSNTGRVAKILINPTYLVNFASSPAGVGSVGFTIDGGASRTTPYTESLSGSHTFLRSQATKVVNSSTVYGFNRWKIVNGTGTFYYNSSSATVNIAANTTATLEYTSLNIYVSSSPDCHPTFTSELGYTHTAAVNLTYPVGSHTFTAAKTVSANSTYRYTFLYWKLNGTTNYPQVSISLNYAGYTTLQLFYSGALVPPEIPMILNYGAYNATWYMRSDTHTVHDQLGYRLLTENTHTPSFDTRTTSGTANTSYGVRVWAIDIRGGKHELSGGSPVATVERTSLGASMLQGYWAAPAYGSMIDAVEVDLYQRFNSEPWVLIRIFVSSDDLLIRLPSSTWTFYYYVNKTLGSTNSTFGWGSYTTYSSRVNLQYYKASPWDTALARLMERNYMGFLFTPWTYWFGDLFWTILLFGMITTAYMRFGSFKPILALLWILGGSGSILWALIPATALHVAAIMLALAMAISLFRLIYK